MQLPANLLIRNVRILDPADGFDGQGFVGLREGRIVWRDTVPPPDTYPHSIDARGLWLMPGIVDLSARLREPGATHKATIASETAAARGAGITALSLPPDTTPVIDHPSVVDRIRRTVADHGCHVRVLPLGALTRGLAGTALAEMSALREAGCAGVSQGMFPFADLGVMRRALEYAAGLDLCVHVVALDGALSAGGCAHEGPLATRLGLPGIPVAAEVAAIRSWLSLVEDTGARVHFGRLTSARAVNLIASAKARQLPVTADVAAHHLALTDAAVGLFDASAHVLPPLRTDQDRQALIEALAEGVIDAICSDHQPHEDDAKTNPFPLTEPGISGLETLLPLSLALVHQGWLEPLGLARCLSLTPAGILGVDGGAIRVGERADLVLLAPDEMWVVDHQSMRSAGHNTPFFGQAMRGRALQSWSGGYQFGSATREAQ